jgi:hypothetical protein
MCDEEPTIVDQYFYTRQRVCGDFFFTEGFAGWVECRVGADKYLVHSAKAKTRQFVIDSDFFQEAEAQFFFEFEEMKEARMTFLRSTK